MRHSVTAIGLVLCAAPLFGTDRAESASRFPATSRADSAAQSAPPAGDVSSRLETAADVRQHVRAALREAAMAKGPVEDAALRQLVAAYRLLQSDQLLSNPQRGELRRTVRSRLERSLDDLQVRLSRAEKSARIKKSEFDERDILAQQGPAIAAPPAVGGQRPLPAGQAIVDYGPELVELIQNTIAPDTWDVYGGNGTIRYYSPLRVLVVRQTGDVHDELGGVLGALRQ